MAHEEVVAENGNNNNFYTGTLRKRLILVLDCVTPHDFEWVISRFDESLLQVLIFFRIRKLFIFNISAHIHQHL